MRHPEADWDRGDSHRRGWLWGWRREWRRDGVTEDELHRQTARRIDGPTRRDGRRDRSRPHPDQRQVDRVGREESETADKTWCCGTRDERATPGGDHGQTGRAMPHEGGEPVAHVRMARSHRVEDLLHIVDDQHARRVGGFPQDPHEPLDSANVGRGDSGPAVGQVGEVGERARVDGIQVQLARLESSRERSRDGSES